MEKKSLRDSLNDNKSTIGMALLFAVPGMLISWGGEPIIEPIFALISITILLCVEGLVLLISNRIVPAIIASAFTYEIFIIVDEIVFQARGSRLMFSDIFCISAAAPVAGRYLKTIQLSDALIRSIITIIVVVLIAFILRKLKLSKIDNNQWGRKRGLFLFAATLATLIFVDVSGYLAYSFHFDELNERYGVMGTFFLEMKTSGTVKPVGYDEEEIEKYFATYVNDEVPKTTPNIIVIMNESFCDYSLIGNLDTNIDPLPFIHGMVNGGTEENETFVYGKTYVPSWAGVTANSEWEFLTGLSMRFVDNSLPYLKYDSTDYRYNIVQNLEKFGYETWAFQPYYAAGYNCKINYLNFGFDNTVFIEDLDENYAQMEFNERPDEEYVKQNEQDMYLRNLVSDKYCFDYITKVYEQKQGPLFMFNVTMQNHSAYDYKGYTNTVLYENDDVDEVAEGKISQYLSLTHETDKALSNLVEYFRKCDEPTIILMFGDHQPGLDNAFYGKVFNNEFKNWTDKEEVERHITPCFFWANYKVDVPDMDEISTNLLAGELLDAAGIPLNAWFDKNAEFHESYKVFSIVGHKDINGEYWDNGGELEDEYHKYEYYLLTR